MKDFALDQTRNVQLTRASVVFELQEFIREWVFPGTYLQETGSKESRWPIRAALQALRQEGRMEIIFNRMFFSTNSGKAINWSSDL